MNAPDLWNDPEAAQAIIDELKSLKVQVVPIREALQKAEDAKVLLELAQEADDEDTRREVDGLATALEKDVDRLETISLLGAGTTTASAT